MRVALFLMAFLLGSCATPDTGSSDYLKATINRSEWATANVLQLDLLTGRYSIKPGVYTEGEARGKARIRQRDGILDASTLQIIQEKASSVRIKGLYKKECFEKPASERDYIIVSNGGPLKIELRVSGQRLKAHDSLECWTTEATALYKAIEESFEDSGGLSAFDENLTQR